MTSHTPHSQPQHAAPGAAAAETHADKARAKADHQHEEARRKAQAHSQHMENVHSIAAPRYHGHRGT